MCLANLCHITEKPKNRNHKLTHINKFLNYRNKEKNLKQGVKINGFVKAQFGASFETFVVTCDECECEVKSIHYMCKHVNRRNEDPGSTFLDILESAAILK